VYLNGHNITTDFAVRPNGRFEGLVTRLVDGANILQVRLPDGTRQGITITNHNNGGPVLSGPQLEPWVCQSGGRCAVQPAAELQVRLPLNRPQQAGVPALR